MKRYYLAYGSNLNLQQMAKRCPRSAPVGTAVLEGFALLFKGSPTRGFYLTVEPKGEAKTSVGVWEIDDGDLPALDRYEGYPALYYKKELRLPVTFRATGETLNCDAFLYIMREDRTPGAPARSYFKSCQDGYRSFGFDETLLLKALERSKNP